MAEDVDLVLVPDMEWEWALGGKLKPSFNLLRKRGVKRLSSSNIFQPKPSELLPTSQETVII
jgi:hypothetical protein